MVAVELRASTSTCPDWSAVKRSWAESGTNCTLAGSSKMAAAMARQRSTSRPDQLPWASGAPKPGAPRFEPQVRTPFCFTLFRVAWAEAAVASRLAVRPMASDARALIMTLSPNVGFVLSPWKWLHRPDVLGRLGLLSGYTQGSAPDGNRCRIRELREPGHLAALDPEGMQEADI